MLQRWKGRLFHGPTKWDAEIVAYSTTNPDSTVHGYGAQSRLLTAREPRGTIHLDATATLGFDMEPYSLNIVHMKLASGVNSPTSSGGSAQL